MKILYIAPFQDGTGYSQAALNYLLAMDYVGLDVVPRPIKLNNRLETVPQRYYELLNKTDKNCNICIQHILPDLTHYYKYFEQNILTFATETSNFKNSSWARYANMFEKVVVFNKQSKQACIDSNVLSPITIIPHAVDVDIFNQNYPTYPFEHNIQNTFKFYYIGEFVRRKNLGTLLTAFYSEFGREEPVSLTLKLSMPGHSEEQLRNEVTKFALSISEGLKIKRFPNVNLITRRLKDEELWSLHESCDCYVNASFGEAWDYSAFYALGFGKTPIVGAHTAYLDYIDNENGWLVDCQKTPCFGAIDTIGDIYTGGELWYQVSTDHLKQCMRQAYVNHNLRKTKSQAGKSSVYSINLSRSGLNNR